MKNFRKNKTGKFQSFAIWIEKTCENCNEQFKIKESSLKYGRGRCCSRKCVDENKRKTYLGKNNGMYGKIESEEHKKIRGQKIKESTTSDTLKKRKIGINLFVKNNGYYPGTDEQSKQKRKDTFLKKYGVDHNWKVKEIRKKCDKTCIKLYGKSAWDLFVDSSLYGHDTKIEKQIHKILDGENITYTSHFSLSYGTSYREYDIFIPSLNLLIELDGDFWHANPKLFGGQKSVLYEIQVRNKENDIIKNELAKKNGYNLIRFWESDMKQNNFEELFFNELKKYGYNKN